MRRHTERPRNRAAAQREARRIMKAADLAQIIERARRDDLARRLRRVIAIEESIDLATDLDHGVDGLTWESN